MPISPVPPLTPMTRDQIMARARFWVDQDVHYFTRDGHRPAEALDPDGQPYRTDCSGYVAMAGRPVRNRPPRSSTCSGTRSASTNCCPATPAVEGEGGYGPDGGHVLLFGGWADPEQRNYLAYELAGGNCTRQLTVPYPYWRDDHRYVPWRYAGITEPKSP